MTEGELKEIALRYVEKSYDYEQLMDGDDLYDATDSEKERCGEYWVECRKIGIDAFYQRLNEEN